MTDFNLGIDPTQLPPIDSVDPVHREQIEGKIRDLTAHARTDEEVVSILEGLLRETAQGMVWDEEGNETRVVGAGDSGYWSPEQIEAETEDAPTGADWTRRGILALLVFALAFLGWYVWARMSPPVEEEVVTEVTPTAVSLEANILSLADELGGRLTMGQPSTIELLPPMSPPGTSGTVLGVINAPIKGRSMEVSPSMNERNDLTQWLFGSVINYVFGVSPTVMDQTALGTTVLIRTDTGRTMSFVCSEQREVAVQQVESVFLQNSPGLTLFPLPSMNNTMKVLWCPYDPMQELANNGGTSTAVSFGEPLIAEPVTMRVNEVEFGARTDGNYGLQLRGSLEADPAVGYGVVIMSIDSPAGRFSPDGDTYTATGALVPWMANFSLPPSALGVPLTLEIRSPTGTSARMELGSFPNPLNSVTVRLELPRWDENTKEVFFDVILTNEGTATARITADMLKASQAERPLPLYLDPIMPMTLPPGRQERFTVRTTPSTSDAVRIQVINTVWDILGVPAQ
jgi:hypothetical protein